MIALWLLAAQAAEPAAVARWEVVGAHPDDGFVFAALGEPVRRLPWTGGSALRVECPEGERPRRVGLARGGLVAIDGDDPVEAEGAWLFPPAPSSVSWTGWLLAPADCRVERLRTDPGPWTWAWAEWDAGREPPDIVPTVGEAADTWASTDPMRRAALRPPGPHPVGYAQVAIGGAGEAEVDGEGWARLAEPAEITLRGPLRVRASLRDLAGRESLCIEIDGEPSCALAGPARETLLVDGDLKVQTRRLEDGTRVGRTNHFALAVGPGTHRLSLPAEALARVTAHRAETWGRGPSLPAGHAVWTAPPGTPWSTVPVEGGVPTWLVDPEPGRLTPDDVRWLTVDGLPADAVRPEADELTLWLEPAPGPCTVQLGEQRFVAQAPRGRFTFSWVGPGPAADRPELAVTGCRAWLRSASGLAPGVRTLSLQSRLGPAGQLVVRGDPTLPARADVSPRRGQDRVVVRVTATHGPEAGRTRAWTLVPAELAPPHETADGATWSEPVRLPLPLGERWRIETDGDVLVRVRQPAPVQVGTLGVAPLPPPELAPELRSDLPTPPPPPNAPTATRERVRAISATVADAEDDITRVSALLERARLLAGLGLLELAGRDLALAEELDPDAEGIQDDVLHALRLERERILFGADRWRADSALWVERGATEADAAVFDRARLAGSDDPLGVARASAAPEDVRWWLRAVYGGQILDASERTAAFRAVAVGAAPDHPALAGVRGLTTWRALTLVRGASVQVEVPWDDRASDGLELLFPDDWPLAATVGLAPGWALRLAPRAGGWSLPVRCRPLRADVERRCRFVASDVAGRVLAQVDVGSWGRAGTLAVPSGRVAYVRLQGRGAVGQVRWPTQRPPVAVREASSVGSGREVSGDVLGPTVVLAEVLPRGRGPVTARARVGKGEWAAIPVPADGRMMIPIDTAGPARVALRFDRPVYLRLSQRRPVRGGPTPSFDRGWLRAPDPVRLAATAEPAATTGSPPPPASAPRSIPTGLPSDSPPLTAVGEVWVGSATPYVHEPGRPEGGLPVGGASVGVRSRASESLWLEADVGGQVGLRDHRVGWVHGGLDRRLGGGRTRTSLLTDVDLAVGPFAGAPLATAHARVGLRALHPLGGAWVFEGIGSVQGHLRSELDPTSAFPSDRPVLWSRQLEDHRAALDLLAGLRWRLGPWSSSRVALNLGSNELGQGQPLDHVVVEARTDLGLPRLWTRLRASLDLRLADADRPLTYASPQLEVRAAYTGWPRVGLGLRPWVWARWRPVLSTASLLVGFEARLGPPRALTDERPSKLAERHLGEAGFWRRAAERWPAGPAGSAAEGATTGPEAVTDRPGDALPDEGGS